MPSQQILNKRKPRSVSSFLKKTYEILESPENCHAIRWADSGVGFVVIREEDFSKQVLPKYFKHSNYSSFVRQLNMYNFHKIRETNCQSHFHHECFRRANKSLLSEIRRKPEKKKRKNEDSEEEQDNNEHYQQKSEVSLKLRAKPSSHYPSIARINLRSEEDDPAIRSYRSTDRKGTEPTRHGFAQEKENECCPSEEDRNGGSETKENYESKERVSIQNILLSSCADNDDDKLSINNELGDNFPRCPTRQMFYPSTNNIYPFPANLKGTMGLSYFNILF